MAKKTNPWLVLVKKYYKEVIAEGKLKGAAAMKEAIKRARKLYQKQKGVKGGPAEYAKGKAGRKVRSLSLGRGKGIGKGKGPIGIPRGIK